MEAENGLITVEASTCYFEERLQKVLVSLGLSETLICTQCCSVNMVLVQQHPCMHGFGKYLNVTFCVIG